MRISDPTSNDSIPFPKKRQPLPGGGEETVRVLRKRRWRAGLTLLEVMASMAIFAFSAGGIIAGLMHARRISEDNLAQTVAQAVGQGIIEQVVSVHPSRLSDTGETTVQIKLPELTDTNYTSMPFYTIPWATSDTAYTQIGTQNVGMLIDAAYISERNEIRPERYLRMEINLQREVRAADNRIHLVLRYRWAVPSKTLVSGAPVYRNGEIRTIRSTALRF